ncbi:MAG: AMP-binding protein, partial [Verrucomicrobiota bacterium]|nr:AMP-binding protein [Verrucomicrobiota bacterium]
DPVAFFYTQHDLANLGRTGERMMRVAAATREMRMLNMFPFAPHLAFWQAHYAGTKFGAFVVSTGGGKVMGTEGNLRLLKKIEPEVLIGMPTFVYHVLHEAAKEQTRCPKLAKIVLGGEKVPVGMRRKLRDLADELGAPEVEVIATYGFTEAKMAWSECPCPGEESSGYHLYPDLGILEVIDPATGEILPDGRPGELVFTPLDARGSVVLRYRTGDYIDGGLFFDPCPYCHRRVPRLVGNISRSSEIKEMRLDKLKGTLVDLNQLEHILDNFAQVGTWQVELRKIDDDPLELDELVLHVQKLDGADDTRLRAEINERFAAEMEIRPNEIFFHSAQELRRMQGVGTKLKEERIVDHRPPVSAVPSRVPAGAPR